MKNLKTFEEYKYLNLGNKGYKRIGITGNVYDDAPEKDPNEPFFNKDKRKYRQEKQYNITTADQRKRETYVTNQMKNRQYLDDIESESELDLELMNKGLFRNKEEREDANEGKKPSSGLTKKQKSTVVKKARKGEDIGKKGKHFDEVAAKAAKQYGSKERGEKVAAAAMWKNIKRGR